MCDRVALRIAHTVIDESPCALQSRYPVDHRTKAVWGVLASAPRVPLLRVELLAVAATQSRLHYRAQAPAGRVRAHATDRRKRRTFLQAAIGITSSGPDERRILVDRGQLNVRVIVAGRYLAAN